MGDIATITVFTLLIACASTLMILPFGIAAGWLLAHRRFWGKSAVETVLALPLVIPPVATGLILLKLFGRRSPLGMLLSEKLGIEVIFTWKAVLLATAVMSFPLLVRSARVAFEEVDPRLEKVARTLGAGPWRVFFTISLPLARRGVVAGALLSFARALGEFGATVMVAGYFVGETATLSLGIYHLVQLGRDDEALVLLGISVALAYAAVFTSEQLIRRARNRS
ncbi:MAG: molybdate ABC transporter permease subunit [Opitutaceae bacterium]|nr:molybdate ABC transporter permease subunit [Opitutaceae bacterium]